MIYEDARNISASVGTSSTQISPNKARSEIVITNTSTGGQNITLSFGSPATAGAGILLTPYSTYFASNTTGFSVWTGEIYAISSAASGTLGIFER